MGGSGPAPPSTTDVDAAEGAGSRAGSASPAAAAASAPGEASRSNGGSANGGSGMDEGHDWRSMVAARIAAHEEKAARLAAEGKEGPREGAAGGGARKAGKEKENEPRMLSPNEVSTLTLKAKVAGALRSNPSALGMCLYKVFGRKALRPRS